VFHSFSLRSQNAENFQFEIEDINPLRNNRFLFFSHEDFFLKWAGMKIRMNAAVALALELEQEHKTSLTMSEDVTMSMSRRESATLPTATTALARTVTVVASTIWTQLLITWRFME
jgi:hypothetical protein